MNDALNARISDNVALTIGRLVMEKIEAQTAADFFAAQVEALQKRVTELSPPPET